MKLKTALISFAVVAATAVPALAQEFVTGIGYGVDRNQAMSHMVIAWTQGASTLYESVNWNLATRGPVACVELQPQASAMVMNDPTPGANIAIFGDLSTASWSCTVEAAMR